MPFGLVFGAVIFTIVGLWVGIEMIVTLPFLEKIAGAFMILVGVSLGVGLLKRQPAARWVGVVTAAIFTLVGLARVTVRGAVIDHVLFLAAAAAIVLLILPATGNVRRGLTETEGPAVKRGNGFGWTAAVCLVLFLALFGAGLTARLAAMATGAPVEGGVQPGWVGFTAGMEKAKSEGKPVFIDFYADWCAPCRMMDRTTFRNQEVARKLDEIVPVKIDSEDITRVDGVSGAELADRYGVTGYPTLVILDPDGKEVARRNGYVNARTLLRWLDRNLPAD